MDHMQITIEQEHKDDGALFIHVQINGNVLPDLLDVETFFALKQQNGHLPLLTCGCGIFDCGGHFVDVTSTEEALILRNRYHRFDHSLEAEFDYHLDWPQVRGIAEEILTYLQKLQERNPQAFVTTGYAGGNLLDRLPAYRESSLLLEKS